MSDDKPAEPKIETYDEGKGRLLTIYEMLLEELLVARNTIQEEMSGKSAPNTGYLMAQERMNVAFENAVRAIEECGIMDEADMRCHDCGELVVEHDDDGAVDTDDGDGSPPPPHQLN